MATLLLHHSSFANHQTEPGHPERPDRYRVVEAVLGQPQFDPLVEKESQDEIRVSFDHFTFYRGVLGLEPDENVREVIRSDCHAAAKTKSSCQESDWSLQLLHHCGA